MFKSLKISLLVAVVLVLSGCLKLKSGFTYASPAVTTNLTSLVSTAHDVQRNSKGIVVVGSKGNQEVLLTFGPDGKFLGSSDLSDATNQKFGFLDDSADKISLPLLRSVGTNSFRYFAYEQNGFGFVTAGPNFWHVNAKSALFNRGLNTLWLGSLVYDSATSSVELSVTNSGTQPTLQLNLDVNELAFASGPVLSFGETPSEVFAAYATAKPDVTDPSGLNFENSLYIAKTGTSVASAVGKTFYGLANVKKLKYAAGNLILVAKDSRGVFARRIEKASLKPDATYGKDGYADLEPVIDGRKIFATRAEVDDLGRVVACGVIDQGTNRGQLVLYRLSADGKPDTTFSNGVPYLAIDNGSDRDCAAFKISGQYLVVSQRGRDRSDVRLDLVAFP